MEIYFAHVSLVLLASDSFKTFEELKTEVSKLYNQHNVHEHQVSIVYIHIYLL